MEIEYIGECDYKPYVFYELIYKSMPLLISVEPGDPNDWPISEESRVYVWLECLEEIDLDNYLDSFNTVNYITLLEDIPLKKLKDMLCSEDRVRVAIEDYINEIKSKVQYVTNLTRFKEILDAYTTIN